MAFLYIVPGSLDQRRVDRDIIMLSLDGVWESNLCLSSMPDFDFQNTV